MVWRGDLKINFSPNICKNSFTSIYASFIDILFYFVFNNYSTPGNPVFCIKNDEKPIKKISEFSDLRNHNISLH